MDSLSDDSFVLRELGLTQLPDEEKREVLADVTQNMLLRVYAKILERLPEEQRPLYVRLVEDGAMVEAEELATAFIAEIQSLIKNACDEVLAEYKEPLET